MSEPAGLGLSLDDLIKRSSTSHRKHEGGAKRGGMAGGRGGGGSPIGVRAGGIAKRVVPEARTFNSATGRNGNSNGSGAGAASGSRPGRGGGAFGGPSNRAAYNSGNDSGQLRPARMDTSYDDAGTLNVRLVKTDIVSVAPNGQVTLTSGGWRTPTTLNCINRVLNLIGASLGCQGAPQDSNWQVSVGTVLTRFEDGMKIPSKGRATADRAQLIYEGLQHGMEPPQGRGFSGAPSFSNGNNNNSNNGGGGFQAGQNRNGNWDNNNFNSGNRRNNGQQAGGNQQNNGMQYANNGGGFGTGGGSSNGGGMDMNDPATAAVMMAGYRMGLQRSMAAAGGAGAMANSMMGFGGMGGMGECKAV